MGRDFWEREGETKKKREGSCRREEMKEERVDEVGESRTGGNKSPCWSQ